jgi:hypothetical protein
LGTGCGLPIPFLIKTEKCSLDNKWKTVKEGGKQTKATKRKMKENGINGKCKEVGR